MADLTPAGRRGRVLGSDSAPADSAGSERAQLILVGAFALALMFVTLALVMNAAIYTENLATRSESAGTADALAFQRSTSAAATNAITYANAVNDSDYTDLEANVSDAMATYYNVTRQQQVDGGQLVDIAVASTTRGTNITDESGDFQSTTDGDDWRLAPNVDNTRKFRIEVDSFDTTANEEFRVVATNVETWYLNVSHDGSYAVGVNDSGSYTACPAPGPPPFTINVSAGTVDGTPCPALDLHEVGTYDLEFQNGSVASGQYSVVVDEVESWSSPDPGDPVADEALYAMRVELVYWTPELRYTTTVRVAPGEYDG